MTSAGTTRRLALLGIVLAMALPALLIACGGDSPDAGGERAATPGTEAASTPRTGAATAAAMPGDAPTPTAAPRATASKAPPPTIEWGSVETDREALVALYNATGGPNWKYDDSWLTDALLDDWFGVDTDDNGRVTVLWLTWNELSGELPPELGSLANLERLNLRRTELSGCVPSRLEGQLDMTFSHLGGLAFC